MKRVTLLCGLLLALTASVAAAGQGVGLRWNNCIGDGGVVARVFTCTSNAGANALVGTFELGNDLAQVSGQEIVVDIGAAGGSLPAWWAFKNVGTCRQASLTFNGVISAAAVNCVDWSAGAAAGGIGAYNIGARGPNTARMVCALAVPVSGLADLSAGQEYFTFNMNINNAKTVGTGSCAGCLTSVCIVFNSINLTTPIAANNRLITGPSNGIDADFATWQGGGGVTIGGISGCGAATPTRNATWGAVKALYNH